MNTRVALLVSYLICLMVVGALIYQTAQIFRSMADPCLRAKAQGVYIPECATRN